MRKNLFLVLILNECDDCENVSEAVIESLKEVHFLKHGESVEITADSQHNTLLFYRSFPVFGFGRKR